MKDKLRIGVAGLGGRGRGLLIGEILAMDDIEIVALCDDDGENLKKAVDAVEQARGTTPVTFDNHMDFLNMREIEAVLVTTSWYSHVEVSIDAMRAGKAVGCEVGCADTVGQCFELLRAHEETRVPCMMLENCCYGQNELMVLNMARQGVFGEIVHVSGGYHHDLRAHLVGRYPDHYRGHYYINRNGDNYPTHELGPLAVLLRLGRGNRMLSLSSYASKSAGIKDYINRNRPPDDPLNTKIIGQGDIITTLIKCANGETIALTLDTTLPRAYSRGFTVRGSRGMYQEDTHSIFLDDVHDHNQPLSAFWNNAENYHEQYEHPVWREFMLDGLRGGHGGMDRLMLTRFFKALKEGRPLPLDAYDMASWMSIYPLSEMSVARGGAPVDVPDFTNGRWMRNTVDWTL